MPGCEYPPRRAGPAQPSPAQGARELRRTAATQGGAGRGEEHGGAPRNSAPFAPAQRGVASQAWISFGFRNRPGTYFEEPQDHKHRFTSVQNPLTRAGQKPLSSQTPAEGTGTASCARQRQLRAVSFSRSLRGGVATTAWENGFFMNGRERSASAHARRSRFYEWVGTRDPRARMRRAPFFFFFLLSFFFFYEWGAGKELNP